MELLDRCLWVFCLAVMFVICVADAYCFFRTPYSEFSNLGFFLWLANTIPADVLLLAYAKRFWRWWAGPRCLLHLDVKLNDGDCYACAIEVLDRRRRHGGFSSDFPKQDLKRLVWALEERNRRLREQVAKIEGREL